MRTLKDWAPHTFIERLPHHLHPLPAAGTPPSPTPSSPQVVLLGIQQMLDECSGPDDYRSSYRSAKQRSMTTRGQNGAFARLLNYLI